VGDGSAGPGFGDLYATIFLPSCSGGDCHNPGSRGGVNVLTELNAFNSLVTFVVPGNAAASRLYQIVVSGEMPRGGPRLSSTELADIADWIDRGAPND
jgi:mono/diheme cytochrome c family protein